MLPVGAPFVYASTSTLFRIGYGLTSSPIVGYVSFFGMVIPPSFLKRFEENVKELSVGIDILPAAVVCGRLKYMM